jgi:hypothetical protein
MSDPSTIVPPQNMINQIATTTALVSINEFQSDIEFKIDMFVPF